MKILLLIPRVLMGLLTVLDTDYELILINDGSTDNTELDLLEEEKLDPLRKIFNVMLVKRYAFDVEMLAVASRLNLKIKESPIKITLDCSFKFREMVNMFIDVLGISYRLRIIHFYQKSCK